MITPLFPQPAAARPLSGCYLALPVHQWQQDSGGLLLYSNYISSLDGRIAIRHHEREDYHVPGSIANPRDWRLYQELAAHADVLITSGRFYRQWAAGVHQGEQPIGSETAFDDIRQWRVHQGMPAQPDVLIVSQSLALPDAALQSMQQQRRKVLVACTEQSPGREVERLRQLGVIVQSCGVSRVDGHVLAAWLQQQGYRTGCMLAGAEVHSTLLRAGVLDYLFLTLRHQLVAQDDFHTISSGNWPHATALQLRHLFHDSHTEQLFACYRVGKPACSGCS